jgi:hypothetical protein
MGNHVTYIWLIVLAIVVILMLAGVPWYGQSSRHPLLWLPGFDDRYWGIRVLGELAHIKLLTQVATLMALAFMTVMGVIIAGGVALAIGYALWFCVAR